MNDHAWPAALALEVPLIQAPMAGGPTTPALVAAVSAAGGLGSLGASYLSASALEEAIREIRALTDRPFAVNLFAGGYEDAARPVDPTPMLATLATIHRELGLEPPITPPLTPDPFAEQLEVVLATRPAVFSFTFGIPSTRDLRRLRDAGVATLGTATTVDEARRLAAAGVDGIVVQGGEAGGHRGTFAGPFAEAMLPVRELTGAVAAAVESPVIAAGGLMDGGDIGEVIALGAVAASLGTAFLTTTESGTNDVQRQAILAATGDVTLITRAFSGRPARAMANAFTDLLAGRDGDLLPYPRQNALTRPMRTAAAKAGDPRWLSMYAGTGVARARPMSAGDLVRQLAVELAESQGGRSAADPATSRRAPADDAR